MRGLLHMFLSLSAMICIFLGVLETGVQTPQGALLVVGGVVVQMLLFLGDTR